MIDRAGIWLTRFKKETKECYPDYQHDVPEASELHLGRLQGKNITLDTCNAARKLGRDLVERVEEVALRRNVTPLKTNGKEMKTTVEPCQNHQRNIWLDSTIIAMSKYLKNILTENNIVFEGDLRVHMDI